MTDVAALMVRLQVFTLAPPLEQPPDQMASRPLVTLNVITVPVVKLALPVVPTLTLSPAGLEETVSPVRPVAVSVNQAPAGCGLTVRVAVRMAPPPEPVIVTAVELTTALVVTAKVALVAPAPTVTLAGTVATPEFELARLTRSPALGAALVKVAVPVAEAPPVTVAGFRVIALRLTGGGTGLTVSTAVRVTPPKVPEIDNAVVAITLVVVIEKVALVAPAAMVTLAGTVATAVFALLRPTTAPPAGAPAVSVTVPCDELPPTTEVGVTLTEDKLATGGGAAVVTVKLPGSSTPPAPNPPLVAVPLGVVTVTPPVAAPAGTVAVTCAFPVTLNSAGRPPEPNVTWLAPPR